jgi:hypothetical protein
MKTGWGIRSRRGRKSAEGHLLDGFHRVAKAYLLGMEEIPAVQFAELRPAGGREAIANPEPDRIRPLPDWLQRTL